jgi:Glycosyl hydrolases family 43
VSALFSRLMLVALACAVGCNATESQLESEWQAADSEPFDLSAEPEAMTAFARGLAQERFGADPAAISVANVLHVYSTSRRGLNIPHFIGADPTRVDFVDGPTEALPDEERGVHLTGGIWAPTVRRVDDHYALWYSGEVAGNGKKCLWRARASHPEGPFRRVGDGTPICPHDNWNIDPYLVRTPQGWWLQAKVGGQLQQRRLAEDGLTFASGSSWEPVLGPSQDWEQGAGQDRPLVENPALVRLARANGNQRWIFFYSANAWRTTGYAIGYADCGNDVEPGHCTKQTIRNAWMKSGAEGPFGPGAASFFKYQDLDYMIVHGWQNRCNDPADTCRSSADPCPVGARDLDCRFENPKGRSLSLFRVALGADGIPVAKAL